MSALEKSTRRKIFYGMLVLFFMIIPAVILYSRGYIFDWARRSLIETGGIFVKANRSGAKVIIDSEALKETSFISGGALVTNLLPRRYTLRLEKEGYQAWQKVVRISSQEVLEFRDVFLPPATITPQIVYNIRRDEPSRLVMLSGRAELGLEVGDPSGPFTVFAINPETRLARINIIQARRWFWDAESQTFFIARQESGRLVWYKLGIGPRASFKEERIVFRGMPQGFSSDDVRPHPNLDNEFYFFAGGALFLQGRSSVPVPIAEEMHSYVISPEHIYFVTKNGFFVESNLDGRETKILGRKGLFLDSANPAKIFISPVQDVLVMDSAGGLFLYQPGRDQELEFLAGNVSGLDFSEKGDRMLFYEDNRVWIYWLRDNPNQPFDLARTKKQLFYSDEPIRSSWLNAAGTHVFFSTDARIRMVEVDDRASVNSYDLIRGTIRAFIFDKGEDVLWWVEGGRLLSVSLK